MVKATTSIAHCCTIFIGHLGIDIEIQISISDRSSGWAINYHFMSFLHSAIFTIGAIGKSFLLAQFGLETVIWFPPLILIIGLLELDHLMRFAQGKQGHTYNIREEMGEARRILGGASGCLSNIWSFRRSSAFLHHPVPLVDLLVQLCSENL